MTREAQEEIGLKIVPSDLTLKTIIHRKTDRNNIDLFFECLNRRGTILNIEPQKCKEIDLFPLDQLPFNTIPYIRDSIDNILKNILFYH